jgi:ABC-type transport system involved in cytochrome c biogenesis permease component
MATWTLAKKDLRLLLRDRRAVVILLAMPFVFILVLGMSLGEGFGQKPDDRLRVSVVNLDWGYRQFESVALWSATPGLGSLAGEARIVGMLAFGQAASTFEPWSKVVLRDLAQTGGIRVEIIGSRAEAKRLVDTSKRAAVLVFGPEFSERVAQCSFLAEGINPFYRDGVRLDALDVELFRDETQLTAASIIEQVAQGTLLRVVLPWMIGRAFERIGEPSFLELLAKEKDLPGAVRFFLQIGSPKDKLALSRGLQNSLQHLFPKYNLTAKTWAALTRSEPHHADGAAATTYHDEGGSGLLKRGAMRYQLLVPSYTVMFAFFLVLTVGWLFVAERRQGTLKRLRAAPISRTEILLGKMIPCYLLSLGQGLFLLAAGKLVFGMSWGPQPGWLLLVVACTSLAAMGLALLIAALARTETQVAIYGTLLVLVLAGVSGCLMGDRSLMPESMQQLSRLTPHAWALDAYRQLLTSSTPNVSIVAEACGVLAAFGIGFTILAWWVLKLE